MTKESFNIIHGWPDLGYYYFPSQPPFSMEINFYGALHFSSKRDINQSGGAKNVALLYAGEKLEQENIRYGLTALRLSLSINTWELLKVMLGQLTTQIQL